MINNNLWFDIEITHFNGFAPICANVDKIVHKYLSGFYEKMKQRNSTKKKIVDKDVEYEIAHYNLKVSQEEIEQVIEAYMAQDWSQINSFILFLIS